MDAQKKYFLTLSGLMVCNQMIWQDIRLHMDYPTSRRQPDEVKSIWSPSGVVWRREGDFVGLLYRVASFKYSQLPLQLLTSYNLLKFSIFDDVIFEQTLMRGNLSNTTLNLPIFAILVFPLK